MLLRYLKLVIFIIFLFSFPSDSCLSKNNLRIVSLAPSITESLYILGLEENIVGVSSQCDLKDKPVVGTLLEPNIEKISSLSPDLVIATEEGNSLRAIEKLRSLKIKTLVVGPDKNFSDIVRDFIKIAQATRQEERAKVIVAAIKEELDSIRDKLKDVKKPKVFFQIGSFPLVTIGKKSFLHEMLVFCAAENIFSDVESAYLRVNKEEVIKRNPDIIIIVPMSLASNTEIEEWSRFSMLNAVKHKKVYALKNNSFLRPTPADFLEGVRLLGHLIHPETFK